MNAALGFVTAQLQYGLDSILVRPRRTIGPFTAQVTLSEIHVDEVEITDHPVDMNAPITDHAYVRPAELTIEAAWSNSPSVRGLLEGAVAGIQSTVTGNTATSVREFYAKMVKLQAERIPFEVYTGKRFYRDMLIKTLRVTTDKETENSLLVTVTLRQLIMVSTQLLSVYSQPEDQADPSITGGTSNKGTKNPVPSNQYLDAAESAILRGVQ